MIKGLQSLKLITGLCLVMYEPGLKPATSTAVISVGNRSNFQERIFKIFPMLLIKNHVLLHAYCSIDYLMHQYMKHVSAHGDYSCV